MRIGIASHNYPPHLGGLEAIVHQLARRFAREHDVTVVTTAWDGRRGVTKEEGVTVHRLPAWHGTEERGVPYATPVGPGIFDALAALRSCDVVHAHGSLYSTTMLGSWARRPGVPLFITEHVGFVEYQSRALNTLQKLAWTSIGSPLVRRSHKVIAYNSRVADWLSTRFGPGSVAFVANGVETTAFRPVSIDEQRQARQRLGLPVGERLALFVGRAAQKKNLEVMLASTPRGYRLVVCGAKRVLPDDVFNLGALPYASMPHVFAAVDFLVHPATGEGFPVTVQEAMAGGLPVVLLWDSGYAQSVSRDALVAVESLDAVGSAAARLAADPEQRAAISRRARDYAVQNWDWDVTVSRHLELFAAARWPQS